MTYQDSGLRQLQNDIMGTTRVITKAQLALLQPLTLPQPCYKGVRKGDWPDYGLTRVWMQLMDSAQPNHRI